MNRPGLWIAMLLFFGAICYGIISDRPPSTPNESTGIRDIQPKEKR